MSIPRDDLLFYLDGILGQISVARKLFEHEQINPVALDSVFASVMSVRSIVEADAPDTEDPEDGCPHPPSSQKRTDVGGGGWYVMCLACNELIAQSGADTAE